MRSGTRRALLSALAVSGATACAALIGLDEGTPRDAAPDASVGDAPSAAPLAESGPVPTSYRPVTDANGWELVALDADAGAGRAPPASFQGALFDGQRVTFIPYGDCESGTLASFDPSKPFVQLSSWDLFDLRKVKDGARGFIGGAFDGKQLYFAPNCVTSTDGDGNSITVPSSTFVTHEVALALDAGWQPRDTTTAAPTATGYRGAVFDGRFVYFSPATHGVVVRYDPSVGDGAAAFASFDTQGLTPKASTFEGAAFDGKYVYFPPGPADPCTSVVARHTVAGAFGDKASWTAFDLKALDAGAVWCRGGGVFDGTYLYLLPFGGGVVARLDVAKPFDAATSWSLFDLATTSAKGKHFGGGGFDGRHVYLVPAPSSGAPSVVVRFDSQSAFVDPASWTLFDLATKDPSLTVKGFVGAAFDGRWMYFAPGGAPLVAARFDARTPPALPPTYRGSFL
jgi:hypothetical protein